jgi:hypothetical protein
MFNRVRHFIKTITLNSGLNREKFINNKKNVNKVVNSNKNKNKNNNMIIVRKMSTYAHPSGNNNDNNNNNNNMGYMFIMALGVYISHNFNKKR